MKFFFSKKGSEGVRETGRGDGKNVESHRPLCTALFENLTLNSASFSSRCLLCLDFGSTFCIQFRDARMFPEATAEMQLVCVMSMGAPSHAPGESR